MGKRSKILGIMYFKGGGNVYSRKGVWQTFNGCDTENRKPLPEMGEERGWSVLIQSPKKDCYGSCQLGV
jgi:hypothetical protein